MAGHPLDIQPLPTVEPIGAPGDDFQHINVTPDMFGAQIGRALGTLGQGIEKASSEGFSVLREQREMQDKTRAADIHSTASDQWSANSGQFLTLEGRAAVGALPGYKQKNKEILDQAIADAPDPYTKQIVQQQSRRVMDAHNEMAERHAAAQEKTYQHNVATQNENSSGNQAVLFATNGDPATAKKFLFDASQEARNQGESRFGFEGDALDQYVKSKRGPYVQEIVQGLARKEGPGYGPKAALEFYQSERDNIDAASSTKIEAFLHDDLTKIAAQKRGEELWRQAGSGLSARMSSVGSDAAAALKEKGVPLNITSGYRSPEHNRAVGGMPHSQHLPDQKGEANAIDVSLKDLTQDQQKAVVSQFLNDPRVGGFGYYPNSQSIHVDVRPGARAAWGTSRQHDSVGENWPDWLTPQVRAWQEGGGAGAAPSGGQTQPQVTAPPLSPASLGGEEQQPATAVPGMSAPMPRSNLPVAIPPTWEEKKAVAEANIKSDPELRERPKLQAALMKDIRERAEIEHAATIDHASAEKAQEKAIKAASDAAENKTLIDIYSDSPKISATQMLKNPDLSEDAKRRLLAHYPKPGDLQHDTLTYGSGFFDIWKAVHAPAGDPGKITDPARLAEMVGPGKPLTIAGYEKLIQEINKPKTPEGEAEAKMKAQFLDNAKREISGEHDNGFIKMKDPKGEQIFLHFLGGFFPAYEEGRRKGKTPAQLLDPESPDYLGKVLHTMKRPPAVWMQDMVEENKAFATAQDAASAGTPAKPAAAPPPKFDPEKASPDELKTAVANGQLSVQEGTAIALKRGFIRENPPPAAPAPEWHVPRSE